MTEQYILGEMLDILIEQDTDLKVNLTQGVGGGTSNIEPAMENGEFDMYPEYTGTAWNMVLKNQDVYSEDKFDQLRAAYNDMGMTWTSMFGFGNTYGLAVRNDIANQYDIKTYSDLARVAPQLTFGAEYDSSSVKTATTRCATPTALISAIRWIWTSALSIKP